jgi:putative ABC transport system permease protein
MLSALKSLARSRGFAAAVILILGVAIALQTSMVAVVNAYLLRSLPYPESGRLYSVSYAQPPAYPPDGLEDLDWASLSDVIEYPIAWDLDMFYVLGGEYPEAAPGAWVTWGFTQGIGIRAALGRTFTEADFAPGQPQVVLISDALWRDRYGRDPQIVGRSFSAFVSDRPDDPETFTVIGVLPEAFWHLNPYTQVLTPLRAANTYPYLVRLQQEVPPAVAAQRIERLARDAKLAVPEGWRVEVKPTHTEYTRAARPMLLAVGAAVTLVFLIACANVGLLMVLRGMRRRKEMAVRLALGAGVMRVARMLLVESMTLVAAATATGLLLAWWALRTFSSSIEINLGRRVPGGLTAMSLDWRVIAIMGAALLVVAIALSLAPLVGSRRIFAALRERRTSSVSGGRHTRSALIAIEVGGSLALLVGCGLMARTVVRLLDVDIGTRVEGIVTATLTMRHQSYPEVQGRAAFYERLIGSLRANGGDAVLSTPTPLATYNPVDVTASSGAAGKASVRLVTSGYFELLDVPVVAGRSISATDRASAERVAVVSQSMAQRLWRGGNPIGQTVRLTEQLSGRDTAVVTRTVVGVVRDVRQSPTDEDLSDLYVPLLQSATRFSAIITRAAATPQTAKNLRRVVSSVDDEIAMRTIESLDEVMSRQLSRPRFLAWLFTAFGIFAATLGAVGLYVVIAYAVKQREHEIAVRMAVGATGRNIVAMVLRDGSFVVLVGLVLGVAGALAVGRLLQAQLFGVRPVDALTLVVATLALALVSLAAILWPARRASKTDPVVALRAE